eukprot:TRINITY_DN2436_c0_g1_i4.p1 TRINITY_DN2436_c0_g1~~TRINITY_DN2436_c0_g1_i4.p1  ORF type:complete len:213 (-),score=-17.73 TRINITY_DN2436_c0_g1_i4:209-781(-)
MSTLWSNLNHITESDIDFFVNTSYKYKICNVYIIAQFKSHNRYQCRFFFFYLRSKIIYSMKKQAQQHVKSRSKPNQCKLFKLYQFLLNLVQFIMININKNQKSRNLCNLKLHISSKASAKPIGKLVSNSPFVRPITYPGALIAQASGLFAKTLPTPMPSNPLRKATLGEPTAVNALLPRGESTPIDQRVN